MSMLDASNFISADVHTREVVLADGKPHRLHFREVPGGIYERALAALRSKNPDDRDAAIPSLIAASLCTEEGEPVLTTEQAAKLKPAVRIAIADAVFAVNPTAYAPADPGNG